jgi:hypothetical protein
MQKNSQNFSMQEALRLANSDAGQRLLAMLRSEKGSSVRQAATSGDPEAVKKALEPMLQSPELKALLKELEERHG